MLNCFRDLCKTFSSLHLWHRTDVKHGFFQVYSSLDLSRGHLEEKREAEGKKESPLTLDSLSWTPDFAEMYVCSHP